MGNTPTNVPKPAPPAAPKINRIGLQVVDYRGGKTTLCAGCGHNAISERIIDAMYEMGVQPERVAKFSGIGCSSKSPAYFMNRSHSFNSVHGRMPSVATGSTKSYKYVQEHEEELNEVGFVPAFEEINVDYDPGTTFQVTMHDGSSLRLRKLEQDYDPTNRIQAVSRLMEAHAKGDVLTGVFYINAKAPSFIDMLNITDQPLASLPESLSRPSRGARARGLVELELDSATES
jgi:hypothetical protein